MAYRVFIIWPITEKKCPRCRGEEKEHLVFQYKSQIHREPQQVENCEKENLKSKARGVTKYTGG